MTDDNLEGLWELHSDGVKFHHVRYLQPANLISALTKDSLGSLIAVAYNAPAGSVVRLQLGVSEDQLATLHAWAEDMLTRIRRHRGEAD